MWGSWKRLTGAGCRFWLEKGVGVEVGVLEQNVPERATVTPGKYANASRTITSTYSPKKAGVSSESLNTFVGNGRAIGSMAGRELAPRVVGSVAPERRQGKVHS
ncbi:hypothetical protein TRVL_09743 [Trypanosoma vivax]|nr:hypothetical protein TRVL_09743 [Trypanosoma vivax]